MIWFLLVMAIFGFVVVGVAIFTAPKEPDDDSIDFDDYDR